LTDDHVPCQTLIIRLNESDEVWFDLPVIVILLKVTSAVAHFEDEGQPDFVPIFWKTWFLFLEFLATALRTVFYWMALPVSRTGSDFGMSPISL
jgi:hypothetical protein